MANKGSEFYDDNGVFEEYMTRRKRQENPNDVIEKPIFLDSVGEVKGLHILDLGCGDAKFGLESINKGCTGYVGLEPSQNMCREAKRTLNGTIGEVHRVTIEEWEYPTNSFDLVVSRLAIHYIEDIENTFKNIYKTLKSSGRFIFSVEHPVITSSYKSYHTSDRHTEWIVDDYFVTGQRLQKWLGSEVIKYHHTIEDYFNALLRAGFSVEGLRESKPRRENFISEETFERRMKIPLFLFLVGRK